ncbi:MAG: N-acetyltransferase [Alphaproteobacteria bacterium HGW-Alphaproteobacteria-2]|nr:MAG: N-acetyltransferase [Alphaproteobacteria bacterium HGW-Alphaproteobacteria-2]
MGQRGISGTTPPRLETALARSDAFATALCGPTVPVRIRPGRPDDLDEVVRLDQQHGENASRAFWEDIFERYLGRRPDERFILVAESQAIDPAEGRLVGFLIGEIRSWEFGTEPCGWVLRLAVDADLRQQHVGEQLFRAVCETFRTAGVHAVRTMVSRKDLLHLAFFRSQGMRAGPFMQLELAFG